MAEKKKEAKKTTATKKKKTSKKIKITYNPIGFNANSMIYFPLYKKNDEGKNVPLIEGIPMELTLVKGEVLEVTQKQLEQLQAENCVETDEEYKERKNFIKGMRNQYPNTFSDLEVAESKGDLIGVHEMQRVIYNDKLIRVD